MHLRLQKIKNSGWFCEKCDNVRNLHEDRNGANHALKNPPKTSTNDDFDASEAEFIDDKFLMT